jgi:hypothetical protein
MAEIAELYELAKAKVAAEEQEKTMSQRLGGAGRFFVSGVFLRSNPEAVRACLRGVIVMHSDRQFNRDGIEYGGYCLEWPQVAQGMIAPEYMPICTDNDDGTISVAWEIKR